MSEYQYYEFRAIDKILTKKQKETISSLSSRAHITSQKASFIYNYGSFSGNIEKLMEECFDIMLYITNWGTTRLMFCIPLPLIDIEKIKNICISDEINYWISKTKKNVILDLNFCNEEQERWIEGEGWLDELIDLRAELIKGDYRILYLAWLKAAEQALDFDEIDEDTLEPMIPFGLKKLSKAQDTYIELIGLNKTLIKVAAKQSKNKNQVINMKKWITKLSKKEQQDFLYRLSLEERNLSVILNKRLHALKEQEEGCEEEKIIKRRSISLLINLTKNLDDKKQKKELEKIEFKRQNKLNDLAARKDKVWKEIYILIAERNTLSYDKAVKLLMNLHELAEYKNELLLFKESIDKITNTYSNRPALLRIMRSFKLIE